SKGEVDRQAFGRHQHALDVPGSGGAGGGIGAGRGAGAAADEGSDAAGQRLVDLLRANVVDMRVDAASGDDLALASDHLGARADDDGNARLDVGIARLADRGDATGLERDVSLVDAGPVDDHRVGDYRVGGAFGV